MRLLVLLGVAACTNSQKTKEEQLAIMWEDSEEYGIANIDDDNNNGTSDWTEDFFAEEDDFATVEINPDIVESLEQGQSLRLRLFSDQIKVYQNGELKMNSSDDDIILDSTDGIQVEFQTYLVSGAMELVLREDGEDVRTSTISLYSSPLLLNHHLQRAEQVYVMEGNGNQSFVKGSCIMS